jgi:hypothetical protein
LRIDGSRFAVNRERQEEDRKRASHARILAALLASTLVSGTALAATDAFDTEASPLFAGRPILELRPRYNRIDESAKPLRTEGFTYRAIAGWRSAPWHGWRLTAEAINTDHIGPKRFNDDGAQFATSPYPLLPDPRYTGANQLYVEYAKPDAFRARVGRQRVGMDNHRWISDNDFRQIPQLFDGVELATTALANMEFSAGHFRRVRTTSGVVNRLELTLFHAAYNPLPGHALAAYGYFHDQPVNGAFTGFANSSYRVAGARAEGAFHAGGVDFPYMLEAAKQRPFAGGDARIDARYWRAGGGVAWRDLTLRYDEELKSSNNGRYGLQMPLTDFYAFNGWTLHFFNTPFQGLRDRWLTLRAGYLPANLVFYAEAHRFRSDFRDLDFGRETDVGLSWSFRGGTLIRLQHGRYEPGSGQVAPRIHKTWITLTYTF